MAGGNSGPPRRVCARSIKCGINKEVVLCVILLCTKNARSLPLQASLFGVWCEIRTSAQDIEGC